MQENTLTEQHADFTRFLQEELLRHRSTDALAAYLQLYPEGVQVNMEELESLLQTLTLEVNQKWSNQIPVWQESME